MNEFVGPIEDLLQRQTEIQQASVDFEARNKKHLAAVEKAYREARQHHGELQRRKLASRSSDICDSAKGNILSGAGWLLLCLTVLLLNWRIVLNLLTLLEF